MTHVFDETFFVLLSCFQVIDIDLHVHALASNRKHLNAEILLLVTQVMLWRGAQKNFTLAYIPLIFGNSHTLP